MNIRVTALEIIFDLLMWYGVSAFTDQDNTLETMFETQEDNMNLSSALALEVSQGGNPVVAKLSELLDDRDLDVRTKVAEGLCKLMMSNIITSSKLFTRLILMWYNPVTDPNGRIRHVLGAFFPLYASLSKENQDSISEALMPTLKTIGSAPVTSPLTGVDLEDVGMFLIQLTNRDFLQSKPENVDELDNCHDAIAFSLCNQIIAEPLSFHIKLYIKLLANLHISTDDFTKLKDLKALYQQMKDCVKDKVYLKSLEKFGQKIEAYLEAYLEQNPNHEEEKEPQAGEGNATAETESAQDNSNNATAGNATKLFRKRALFSQTTNTLLEGDIIDPSTPTPLSTIKELVEKDSTKKIAVPESDDDELLATPNR